MKNAMKIKDWYWDDSIKNMVFEDENGDKYRGKAHHVVKGKAYSIDIDAIPSKDSYPSILKWL